MQMIGLVLMAVEIHVTVMEHLGVETPTIVVVVVVVEVVMEMEEVVGMEAVAAAVVVVVTVDGHLTILVGVDVLLLVQQFPTLNILLIIVWFAKLIIIIHIHSITCHKIYLSPIHQCLVVMVMPVKI